MTTPPETSEDALTGAVSAVDNEELRAIVRGELDRLSPAARAVVARRLREQSEHRLREGRRAVEAERPMPDAAKPIPPAEPMSRVRKVRAFAAACVLVLGFVFFWYGMIFGAPHHSASGGQISTTWQVVRYAWCALLTWMLIRDMNGGRLREAWAVARRVTFSVLIQNVLVIAATVGVGLTLLRLLPALDRSWLYLLPGVDGHAGNLGLMPVQIKYFGIAFLLLFAVSVPELARREETQYRRSTKDWRQGMWRSLRFGLAHCVVGVPLYGGLALTVGGLWFTFQYFRGGVEGSTLHHAVYNWIVVSAALVAAILWSLHP